MRVVQPAAFWLLVLLPCVVLLYHLGQRRQAVFLRHFGDPTPLHQTPSRWPVLHHKWTAVILLVLPFLSIGLALTDPRLPYKAPQLRASALDAVMVLDVSTSMAAEDYGLHSRLEQVQRIARGLLTTLQGHRIGLVTFAGVSFRQAELTNDITALDFILTHWVGLDNISVGGSDVAGALEMGLTIFPEQSDRKQVMLLFSDGGDADDALHAVLRHAVRRGGRIVTLGLGHSEPSRLPLYGPDRKFQGYMPISNRVVTTQLNEAPLQQIAAETGGTYLRLRHGNEWHNLLAYRAVSGKALERQDLRLFQPLLGLGLLAFGLHVLLIRL